MYSRGIWGMIAILFKRLLKQPKLYIIIVLLSVVMDGYIGEAREIPAQYNIHVNAYGAFAFLSSYSLLMLWIVLGFLLLISDVPFASSLSSFVHVRITARQSITARMIFIVLAAVLYVLFVFLLSAIIQNASLFHPLKWDKALRTMAYGKPVGNAFLYAPSVILSSYSPLQAWLLASVLLSAILIVFGIAMFLASLYIDRKVILSLTGIFAALDFAIDYMVLPPYLYYASPLSWCRLEFILTAPHHPAYPPVGYYYIMPLCLLLLLCILAQIMLARPQRFAQTIVTIGGDTND